MTTPDFHEVLVTYAGRRWDGTRLQYAFVNGTDQREMRFGKVLTRFPAIGATYRAETDVEEKRYKVLAWLSRDLRNPLIAEWQLADRAAMVEQDRKRMAAKLAAEPDALLEALRPLRKLMMGARTRGERAAIVAAILEEIRL